MPADHLSVPATAASVEKAAWVCGPSAAGGGPGPMLLVLGRMGTVGDAPVGGAPAGVTGDGFGTVGART
jgi:hypothetical protein